MDALMNTQTVMPEGADYKIVSKVTGTDIITSVACTPAELLGIIQHLVDTFANAAGVSYNQVLADIKEKEDIDVQN